MCKCVEAEATQARTVGVFFSPAKKVEGNHEYQFTESLPRIQKKKKKIDQLVG